MPWIMRLSIQQGERENHCVIDRRELTLPLTNVEAIEAVIRSAMLHYRVVGRPAEVTLADWMAQTIVPAMLTACPPITLPAWTIHLAWERQTTPCLPQKQRSPAPPTHKPTRT